MWVVIAPLLDLNQPSGSSRIASAQTLVRAVGYLNLASGTVRFHTARSVECRPTAIEAFIDGWNERCHPFSWTKTADEILTKARGGQRTSFTRH
jgi:hypothetical protein